MSIRMWRVLPRAMAALILVNLALLMGCGGESGVQNGNIIGKVFSNVRDLSAQRTPEPGVTVVAQREQGIPPLIRTTTTDANGNYTFTDLPTGPYVIGFAKDGFETINTTAGDTAQRTALGSQVRVFIDSGRTSVAAEVTMSALVPSGDATVIVTVLDASTGLPVPGAVVTAGPITSSKNTNGVFTLSVPLVRRDNITKFGDPFANQISVTAVADGFSPLDPFVEQTQNVQLQPGETTRLTIHLIPIFGTNPGAVTFTGTYRFAKFQNQLANTTPIDLSVKNLQTPNPPQPTVNQQSGTWQITGLPPASDAITTPRLFDLIFQSPDIITNLSLSAVPSIKSGTKTFLDPVVLQPITVTVLGDIRVAGAGGALETPQGSSDDKAFLPELGIFGTVTGGTFSIPGVPVRQAANDQGWQLKIIATSPLTNNRFQFTGTIKPLSTTGNNSPEDIFNVGLLVANQAVGSGGGPGGGQ